MATIMPLATLATLVATFVVLLHDVAARPIDQNQANDIMDALLNVWRSDPRISPKLKPLVLLETFEVGPGNYLTDVRLEGLTQAVRTKRCSVTNNPDNTNTIVAEVAVPQINIPYIVNKQILFARPNGRVLAVMRNVRIVMQLRVNLDTGRSRLDSFTLVDVPNFKVENVQDLAVLNPVVKNVLNGIVNSPEGRQILIDDLQIGALNSLRRILVAIDFRQLVGGGFGGNTGSEGRFSPGLSALRAGRFGN